MLILISASVHLTRCQKWLWTWWAQERTTACCHLWRNVSVSISKFGDERMLSDHWKMPQKEWKMEFSGVNQRSTVGQRRVLKHFKSLPGASAAAIFTEMTLKGVFYALWMQKRPSFSLCFIRFLGQPLTIVRGKTSPEPPEKHKILNWISWNVFVDIVLFLVAQKHNTLK